MGFGNWRVCSLLLWVACVKRPVNTTEAMQVAIQDADRAWEQRSESLEPVIAALRAAKAIDEDAPGVMWREARVEIARGLGEPDPTARRASFGKARSLGWACVTGDTAGDLLRELGVAAALAGITGERRECLSWTHLAWARWYAEFGADAAALDRGRLEELAQGGENATGQAALRTRWANSLVAAAEGRDEGWEQVEADVAVVDRYRFLRPEELQDLQGLRMTTPEGRAYQAWVLAARTNPDP